MKCPDDLERKLSAVFALRKQVETNPNIVTVSLGQRRLKVSNNRYMDSYIYRIRREFSTEPVGLKYNDILYVPKSSKYVKILKWV